MIPVAGFSSASRIDIYKYRNVPLKWSFGVWGVGVGGGEVPDGSPLGRIGSRSEKLYIETVWK